jgi:hypothetical protein
MATAWRLFASLYAASVAIRTSECSDGLAFGPGSAAQPVRLRTLLPDKEKIGWFERVRYRGVLRRIKKALAGASAYSEPHGTPAGFLKPCALPRVSHVKA